MTIPTYTVYTVVYKVCKNVNGEFYSAYHEDLDGISVRYQLNRATRPRVGFLFAFTTKEDALLLATSKGEFRCFRARAIVKKEFEPIIDDVLRPNRYPGELSLKRASRLWWKCIMSGDRVDNKGLFLGWQCTRPFVACSSITLLEEVTE